MEFYFKNIPKLALALTSIFQKQPDCMTHNPLLRLLPHLTRKEMTRFKEFAFSPYHNKHKGVRALVEILSASYPKYDEKVYKRELLYQSLFPKQAFDLPKLALIFTYTLRLLERFIQVEIVMKKSDLTNTSSILQFMRERNVSFYLEKKWKENFKGVNNELSIHQLSWLTEMDSSSLSLGRFEVDFLERKQLFLDATYVKEKLKDACELLLRSKYLKRSFETSSILEITLAEVEENNEKYSPFPSINLYNKCFHLLSKSEAGLYLDVFNQVKKSATVLSKDDLKGMYSYLQNFCIAQINLGNEPFLRHLFDIYLSQLERDLLMDEGRLPEWHYKNIVTTGLRLNENDWVRNFLEEYKSRLPPEVAANAYDYNLAAYYYHLKRLPDVLQLLVQVEYTDVRYNLDAKSLLLRTYFDLEEEDALMALCDSFRQYLKRNKSLTEFQKKGYVNLIRFTRRLFKLKANQGFKSNNKWEKDKKKLESDIKAAVGVFNLKWLNEKLDELN